ncbi:P-II family nitrogen regulator [Actinomycetospora endophytica]|uniref:P-II family nitrogen regulator n=1 Tax=Actinomycetospora endophytica TaxID=2291215 RepID=A0ABS8P1F0_9PSEU|nr:P-II family nitrogen regulator [Actinomycetospora endophytica]MCD2192059.1 P-II family nitrogen regulator [Actinomycetospora endophytica]
MKLITAVVTEDHVNSVAQALNAFDVPPAVIFSVLTPTAVRRWETYRGHPRPVDVVESVRVEIVADDDDTGDIVHAIRSAADSGPGWLWVTAVDPASRLEAADCPERAPVPRHDGGGEPGHRRS